MLTAEDEKISGGLLNVSHVGCDEAYHGKVRQLALPDNASRLGLGNADGDGDRDLYARV